MLSVDAGRHVDNVRLARDEDLLLLEARSALRAVQCACDRHQNVRILFFSRQFGVGFGVNQGKNAVSSCACRHSSLCNRIPCKLSLVFRWPSQCLLSRLRVLQQQSVSSLAPHCAASLVNPVDQRVTAESPISLVLQTSVAVLEHQSDGTEAPVSSVDQDFV